MYDMIDGNSVWRKKIQIFELTVVSFVFSVQLIYGVPCLLCFTAAISPTLQGEYWQYLVNILFLLLYIARGVEEGEQDVLQPVLYFLSFYPFFLLSVSNNWLKFFCHISFWKYFSSFCFCIWESFLQNLCF